MQAAFPYPGRPLSTGGRPRLRAECRDPRSVSSSRGAKTVTRPQAGDSRCGLTSIGRPGMTALLRIVIAEPPRFPELGQMQFQLGKLPYFTSVKHYLESEHEAGNADVPDAESAANQFLGMIANYVLWPRMLLTDRDPATSDIRYAVEQAVETTLARYACYRPA